jgi:hypothetical protein
MEDSVDCYESLLRQGADRLRGHQRRLFMAEVALKLCEGNARKTERRFGWGRETVEKGLHELQQGVRCLENFAARGRPRMEDKNPQLAQDIRDLMEPHTQADPKLTSPRRYSSLSAAEVLEAPARKWTPLGILMLATGALTIIFGAQETSDFWVDGLKMWWQLVKDRMPLVRRLVIYLDNGPNNSGSRTQFLKRMIERGVRHGL